MCTIFIAWNSSKIFLTGLPWIENGMHFIKKKFFWNQKNSYFFLYSEVKWLIYYSAKLKWTKYKFFFYFHFSNTYWNQPSSQGVYILIFYFKLVFIKRGLIVRYNWRSFENVSRLIKDLWHFNLTYNNLWFSLLPKLISTLPDKSVV